MIRDISLRISQPVNCTPSTVRAVSKLVKLASFNRIPLGIRSRHWVPWYCASQGISVSIGQLRNFEYSATTQAVTVGAGLSKSEVDGQLEPYGRAVVSTTLSNCGLVGSALEGGIGWLSGKHGLALDNMLEATVVTADGSIVKCSATSHADLFWALKGAGGNFGVVAEATFRTHKQANSVYWAEVTYPASRLAFVLQALGTIHASLPLESRISLRLETVNSRTEVVLRLFHNGSRAEASEVFAPLLSIDSENAPTSSVVRMLPYAALSSVWDSAPDHDSSNNWSSTGINLAGPSLDVQGMMQMCTCFMNSPSFSTSLRFAVLGIEIQNTTRIANPSSENGAFAARNVSAYCYARLVWEDEKENGLCDRHTREFGRKWREALGPKEGSARAYLGFCGAGKYPFAKMEMVLADLSQGKSRQRRHLVRIMRGSGR